MSEIKTAEERIHPLALDDKSVWCNAYFDEVTDLRAYIKQLEQELVNVSEQLAEAKAALAAQTQQSAEAKPYGYAVEEADGEVKFFSTFDRPAESYAFKVKTRKVVPLYVAAQVQKKCPIEPIQDEACTLCMTGEGNCLAAQAQQPKYDIEAIKKRMSEIKSHKPAENIEFTDLPQAQAQQNQEIGEMRENGVNWYGKNPHAFEVGTKFFALPPAPEGDKE